MAAVVEVHVMVGDLGLLRRGRLDDAQRCNAWSCWGVGY